MPQPPYAGAARTVQAGNRRLLDKFSFRIVSPLLSKDIGFENVGGLKITTETIRYRAGGSLVPLKSPGLSDHDAFTATRAATVGGRDLYAWKILVTDSAASLSYAGAYGQGAGGCDPSVYKCWIDIIHTDRCHTPIRRWRLYNTWPSEFTPVDGLDNNASDHVRESITWEYDYFSEREPLSGGPIVISINGSSVKNGLRTGTFGLNVPRVDIAGLVG